MSTVVNHQQIAIKAAIARREAREGAAGDSKTKVKPVMYNPGVHRIYLVRQGKPRQTGRIERIVLRFIHAYNAIPARLNRNKEKYNHE